MLLVQFLKIKFTVCSVIKFSHLFSFIILLLCSWIDKSYVLLIIFPIILIILIIKRLYKGFYYFYFLLSYLLAFYFFLFPIKVDFINLWWPEVGELDYCWFFLGICSLITLNHFKSFDKFNLKIPITKVILFHVAFIFVGIVLYYGLNFKINFYNFFGGELDDRTVSDTIFLYRPSGLHLEPSTYSAVMLSLLIIANNNNVDPRVKLLGIFSMILSMSTIAILYSIILSFSFFYNRKNLRIFIFLLTPILFISTIHYERIQKIILDEGGSIVYKIEAFNFWLNKTFLEKIKGVGIGINDCDCLIADNGFLFSTIYYIGIPLTIIVLIFVFRKQKNKLPLLALFLSKLQLMHPIILVSLFLNSNGKKNNF